MSPQEAAYKARLERRAARMRPDLARRYAEAYKLIRQSLTTTEMADAIRTGRMDELLEALVSDDVTTDPNLARLKARLDQMILDVARAEAQQLPSWLRPEAFNLVSPQVIQAAREFDGSALRTLRDEVRELVTERVAIGLQNGKNPRAIARDIRDAVGLTARQATWVDNFRAELENGDRSALQRMLAKGRLETEEGTTITRRAHAAGEGLTKAQIRLLETKLGTEQIPADQVERMVDAYRKRLVALNTEAHVKTQTLQAQKLGQRAAWEDAIARGVITREALRRKWLTTLDGRERPEHHDLHETVVGFDELFPNGELTPGESTYNCRCVARVFVARDATMDAAGTTGRPAGPENTIAAMEAAATNFDRQIAAARTESRAAYDEYTRLVFAGEAPDAPARVAALKRMNDADARLEELELQKYLAVANAARQSGGTGSAAAPRFDDELGDMLGKARGAWDVTDRLVPSKYLTTSGEWRVTKAVGQRVYADYEERVVTVARASDIPQGVHEFAHMVEKANPSVNRAMIEFRDRRTAGEPLVKLSELFPPSGGFGGYGADEVTRPDKFFSPYIGKEYENDATEVLSMGIERLLRDPRGFYTDDAEHFDLILRFLMGAL